MGGVVSKKKIVPNFNQALMVEPEILSPSSTLCTIKDVQSFVDEWNNQQKIYIE